MNPPDTKRCSVCKEYRPMKAFAIDLNAKIGVKAACKTCESARHRDYYQRRQAEKGPRPRNVGPKPVAPWPLPTHDIQQSLACVQFLKWRGPVNHETMKAAI